MQAITTEQRYLKRQRYLYALVFQGENAIYVGQSIDLKRRCREHEIQSGWNRDFEMRPLGSIEGNHFEAEELEFAWMLAFHRNGWNLYSLPPAVELKNPAHRATAGIRKISQKLQVPQDLRRPEPALIPRLRRWIGDYMGQSIKPLPDPAPMKPESRDSAQEWLKQRQAQIVPQYNPKSDFYDDYVAWCEANHEEVLSREQFWKGVKRWNGDLQTKRSRIRNEAGSSELTYTVNLAIPPKAA